MKNSRAILRWLLITLVVTFALVMQPYARYGWLGLLVPALAVAYSAYLAFVILRRRGRASEA